METKRIVILGALFVLLVVFAVFFFRSGGGEKIKPSAKIVPPEQEPTAEKPVEKKKIVLFFSSEVDSLLHPEEREIPAEASPVQQAKQTIDELLKGSKYGYLSPFPPETELRELYLTPEGVAYVDFSREIQENHLCGSSSEMATVFSVVNSLAYNFKFIKKVFILIDGGEKETLGGHINLTRPFPPQYDLVTK